MKREIAPLFPEDTAESPEVAEEQACIGELIGQIEQATGRQVIAKMYYRHNFGMPDDLLLDDYSRAPRGLMARIYEAVRLQRLSDGLQAEEQVAALTSVDLQQNAS